jgi:beta-mannosidase
MILKIIKSDKILPEKAVSITKHSIFDSIITANQISEFKEVNPTEYELNISKIISLNGLWRRKADFGGLYNYPHEPDFDDFNWPQVMVPDNYGLDGELQRHYNPVWYRREFKFNTDYNIDLVFRGVDYLSDVWINGYYLGHHEGYFAPFCFDITDKIQAINILAVKVQDPCEFLKPWTFFTRHHKKYIKGTLNYHDSRPGGLPGRDLSPKWSSEWGQSLTTGGINQDVYLKITNKLRIDAIFLTPMDLSGRVHIATIITNRDNGALNGKLNFSIEGLNDSRLEKYNFSIELNLGIGSNRIDFEVEIPNPRIWTIENPNLYELEVQAIHDNTISDSKKERFGIRAVKLELDPWQLYLNDKPTFIKAVNYIPVQHFAEVNEAFFDRDAIILKDAFINSVGIHAHIQCPDCYNSFDRNGILIFQDFPLQWSYDSSINTNPGFREKACDQITEMGYMLYNHPSIVYYCCHNEPAYVFDDPKPDPEDDRDNSVLDKLLQKTLQKITPFRYVHRASGTGSDLHVYDGSIGGGSIYDVRKRPTGFVSEFGFWSVGEGSKDWGDIGWPPSEKELIQWASRFGFFASTKTFIGHPKDYPDRETWIMSSQLYGAFLAKYQTEFFRSKTGDPYNAIRWHFFSDWWGYAGGGIVDKDRTPKLPYFAYKNALRPVLLVIDIFNTIIYPDTELQLELVAINDIDKEIEIEWELEFNEVNGSILIVADPAAAGSDGTTGPPAKQYHKIATPIDAFIEKENYETKIIRSLENHNGKITLKPNSVTKIKSIIFKVPNTDEHKSYTIKWKWREKDKDYETNWTHFIIGKKRWRLKPGLHLIENSDSNKISINKS